MDRPKLDLDNVREVMQHIDIPNIGDRPIPTAAILLDDGAWRMCIQDQNGRMVDTKAIPVEACYFAKGPANAGDIRLLFVEFLLQQGAYRDTWPLLSGAITDIHNLAASLAKLELIYRARKSYSGSSNMAATELEYVFLCCRSLFDIVQEIIARLWTRVEFPSGAFKKQKMPTSFKGMILYDGKIMSPEEISQRRQVPIAIATTYHRFAEQFMWLKDYRDSIAHSGKSVDLVFVGDDGIMIPKDLRPFSDMKIWCDANSRPNNLGSLKSAVAHVIGSTHSSIEELIQAFRTTVRFPPPVVPGYAVFVCGFNIQQLDQLPSFISESPWYDSAIELTSVQKL